MNRISSQFYWIWLINNNTTTKVFPPPQISWLHMLDKSVEYHCIVLYPKVFKNKEKTLLTQIMEAGDHQSDVAITWCFFTYSLWLWSLLLCSLSEVCNFLLNTIFFCLSFQVTSFRRFFNIFSGQLQFFSSLCHSHKVFLNQWELPKLICGSQAHTATACPMSSSVCPHKSRRSQPG